MSIKEQIIYREIMNVDSINILKTIIGESLYVVYSSAMEIEDNVITSPSFSIRVKNAWINFANEWLSTSHDINYYRMAIESAIEPRGIKYSIEQKELKHPVSSFLFNRGKDNKEVSTIEIYTRNEVWENENVVYDFAIVITAKNNLKLCISAKENITDQLECTIDRSIIEEILTKCELREILK